MFHLCDNLVKGEGSSMHNSKATLRPLFAKYRLEIMMHFTTLNRPNWANLAQQNRNKSTLLQMIVYFVWNTILAIVTRQENKTKT